MSKLANQSGLPSRVIEKINRVFSTYPHIEQAILFGSRAKGNFRAGSDIDLALTGNMDTAELIRLETQLDDLMLPYTIDLVLFNQIENPDLTAHIRRRGLIFYP